MSSWYKWNIPATYRISLLTCDVFCLGADLEPWSRGTEVHFLFHEPDVCLIENRSPQGREL